MMYFGPEVWEPVPGFLGYFASGNGVIRRPHRTVTQTQNWSGYMVCRMAGRQYRANRIICTTFHGMPPSPKHMAAHKDGKRTNNRPSNLYWATAQQNADDLVRHGTLNGSVGTLSFADVVEIKRLLSLGWEVRYIHQKFPQVTNGAIAQIKHGRSWRHI